MGASLAERIDRVAIVGGGFSGAMLAARLAELGRASTLINRTPDFGLGVAYSTRFEGHLLNVRSGRMSAIADRPDDFVDWLAAFQPSLSDPEGFAPRCLFGLYVQSRLAEVETAHPGLILRRVGDVVAIDPDGLRLKDGDFVAADRVVLTTGNPAPRSTAAADAGGAVIPDPWAHGALDPIATDDDLVLIGTGLTMVDVLVCLKAAGWRGRATALSRRGLLPRAHGTHPDTPAQPTAKLMSGPLSDRLVEARRLSSSGGWREMMEGLRPLTAELWAEADPRSRGRFVRHLRPWWDVHRHRVAPVVANVIDRLREEGHLDIVSGRVRTLHDEGHAIRLGWTPRSGPARPALSGRWLIDCTGPGHAPDSDPLVAPLIRSGRVRLDPLGLGIDLDPSGRALGADGVPDPRLYVLGPPARAAFWETIAVPDIRKRIEDIVAGLVGDRPPTRS